MLWNQSDPIKRSRLYIDSICLHNREFTILSNFVFIICFKTYYLSSGNCTIPKAMDKQKGALRDLNRLCAACWKRGMWMLQIGPCFCKEVILVCNSHVNASTGYSPHEVMYAARLKSEADTVLPPSKQNVFTDIQDYCNQAEGARKEIIENVH